MLESESVEPVAGKGKSKSSNWSSASDVEERGVRGSGACGRLSAMGGRGAWRLVAQGPSRNRDSSGWGAAGSQVSYGAQRGAGR